MKLDPEGVEKAADVILNEWGKHGSLNGLVAAALTAYFDHLKSEGLMREAAGYSYRDEWEVGTARTMKIPSDFKAAIIRTDKD